MVTFRNAIVALVLLILVIGFQHYGFKCHVDFPTLIILNLILVMLEFPLIFFMCVQPEEQDQDPDCFQSPFFPWLSLCLLFTQINVFMFMFVEAKAEVLLWIVIGNTQATLTFDLDNQGSFSFQAWSSSCGKSESHHRVDEGSIKQSVPFLVQHHWHQRPRLVHNKLYNLQKNVLISKNKWSF